MRRAVRFLRRPARERRLLAEAVACLAVARLALGVLPFPRALALFGMRAGGAGTAAPAPAHRNPAAEVEAQAIGRAVARAARHAPFRAVCLQQAFAAALMLHRRGLAAQVHLGVAKDGDTMAAHAWSVCHGVVVTGGGPPPRHTGVAVFGA